MINLHTKLEACVHWLQWYERQCKMQKLGGLGVRFHGHPRSPEMSPFNKARTTSYSTLIETMQQSSAIFEL